MLSAARRRPCRGAGEAGCRTCPRSRCCCRPAAESNEAAHAARQARSPADTRDRRPSPSSWHGVTAGSAAAPTSSRSARRGFGPLAPGYFARSREPMPIGRAYLFPAPLSTGAGNWTMPLRSKVDAQCTGNTGGLHRRADPWEQRRRHRPPLGLPRCPERRTARRAGCC